MRIGANFLLAKIRYLLYLFKKEVIGYPISLESSPGSRDVRWPE